MLQDVRMNIVSTKTDSTRFRYKTTHLWGNTVLQIWDEQNYLFADIRVSDDVENVLRTICEQSAIIPDVVMYKDPEHGWGGVLISNDSIAFAPVKSTLDITPEDDEIPSLAITLFVVGGTA